MRYLNPRPMIFGPLSRKEPTKKVVVRGGPAAKIPREDRCASGRHNKRLTQCFCDLLKK